MSIFIFIFLSFLNLTSLGFSFSDMFQDKEDIPHPDQIMMQIMDQTAAKLEEEYSLSRIGMGMEGKFNCVSIEFQVFRPMDQEEARSIIVECVDLFLNNINSSLPVQDYLTDHPFTEKNVSITFYIRNKNHHKIYHPSICLVCWHGKGVYFRTNDPDKKYGYKETREETHEEALELVKQYRASLVAQLNEKKS